MRTWLREFIVAAAAALAVVGVHLLTRAPARPAWRPPPGSPVEAAMHRKIDHLRLSGTFPEALAQWSQAAGVPVAMDKAVQDQYPDLCQLVVDIEARGASLEKSFSLLIAAASQGEKSLWREVNPTEIRLLMNEPVLRVYDVRDLVDYARAMGGYPEIKSPQPGFNGCYGGHNLFDDPDYLAVEVGDMLFSTRWDESTRWVDSYGWTRVGEKLIVCQSRRQHAGIEGILADVRRGIGLRVAKGATPCSGR